MPLLNKPCVWCDNPTNIENGVMSCDEEGDHVKTLCNPCILFHAGVFLRGRRQFTLAKQVERFIKNLGGQI